MGGRLIGEVSRWQHSSSLLLAAAYRYLFMLVIKAIFLGFREWLQWMDWNWLRFLGFPEINKAIRMNKNKWDSLFLGCNIPDAGILALSDEEM